ncbi:hypothetical protein [Halosegnis sp.]|uniref:hypothetical protein n=1 Tax=Halosegnis sp. TaxID=2864959 RepID=UPI0035D47553
MEERTVRRLQFVAVQFVGAVAVIHFAVGSEQLASIVSNGLLDEYLGGRMLERPRPVLFVGSSLAILAGLLVAGRGRLERRTAYRLGIAAMATYLVGWIAWHTVLDHGFALAGGPAPGTGEEHSHGGLGATLYSHYVAPLLATIGAAGAEGGSARTLLGVVSVTLELAAAALLVVLLRVDPEVARDRADAGLSVDAPER